MRHIHQQESSISSGFVKDRRVGGGQMGEVRKVQKKLRQIENLELKVSLTPEEAVKVHTRQTVHFSVQTSHTLLRSCTHHAH